MGRFYRCWMVYWFSSNFYIKYHKSKTSHFIYLQLVRAVDALSRQAIAELWSSFATSIRIPLSAPLRTPGSWPLPLPGLVLGLSPTARLTEEDVKSLETVRRIWALLEPEIQQQQSSLAGNFLKSSPGKYARFWC